MQTAIVAHPYVTAGALLGLVGAVIMGLRSLLMDDPAEWTAERRHVKGDRLD